MRRTRSPATGMRSRDRSCAMAGPPARTPCCNAWDACPCCATIRSFVRRTVSGRWRATRPRGRCTRLHPSSGWSGEPSKAKSPRVDVIPFESEHKFMATLHGSSGGGQVLFAKGAPEVILDHCDRQETERGDHAPIDREHWMQASDRLAGNGERVLALAWLDNPGVAAGGPPPGGPPQQTWARRW